MRTSRRPAVAAPGLRTAALAAALVLLPAAPPAAAASGIVSPGEGLVVAEHQVVPVRAVVDGPGVRPSELSLLAPGADTAEVVAVQTSPGGGELAYDFDTACARRLCSGRVPAPNGTWTVRLSGAAQDEKRFVVRIPPAAPTVLDAAPAESGAVVRWRLGDEPDLRGYAVEGADGRLVVGDIALDACDAEGTCRAEVPQQGGPWTVRAFRAACPDCTQVLASTASEPVALAAGPAGELPTAPGTTAPAAPGSAGPPAPAGSRQDVDQRSAFTRAFGSGAAAVGAPPGAGQPQAPARLPDGAYDPTLGYAAPQQQAVPAQPGLRGAQDVAGQLLSLDLRLVVAGVLMIGTAVWLRSWARRAIAD